ncbi:hypothetical protein DYB37_006623 [Aphanomyces astaci]|uniref:Uncharacterized protein n=3 Tax=Aphanomyces astaci TaxID=112090 RepID=A0A418FBU9_APHAT|nr:hypothetical protein DYB37_006623 [Aphanomyces astaci]
MEDDPKVSVEGLRGIEVQMRQLLQEEEYDSVVLLGSIFCSATPMSPDKQLEHAVHDLNLVFADALVHKREYKRALLDRIPPSRRTLGMNMLCGNLHLTQGSTRYTPCKSSSCLNSLTIHRQAEVAFLAALTANPYAVEATLALAEIAGKNEERKPNPLDDSDIVHMYTELGETGGIDATDAAWLQSLVDAHIQLHSHQFQCPSCNFHPHIHLFNRPEYAVKSFSHASKLAKTMDAYEGMSEGLCGLCLKGADKYTDAINVARLALMYMPHSPRAYLLLGSVLSLRPESRDKARKAFEKALSMRPKLLRAHFGLVDLLIAETKYPDAIARLSLTQYVGRDVVFAKLGDVHTLNQSFGLALPQYHHALALNPNCVTALRGVDRVEKLLRGDGDASQYDDVMDDRRQSSGSA